MDTIRRPSRTQTNHLKAQYEMKKLQEQMKKVEDNLKKTATATELYKNIKDLLDKGNLTIEEVQDIINDIKEDLEIDINENLDEFNDVQEDIPDDSENISDNAENISDNAENIPDNAENISDNAENISDRAENISDSAEDTSEDEYTEVSDIEGPIDPGVCDEIVDVEFSEEGQQATKQMVERINKEQDIYIKEKKGHYSVKKNGKEIIIENHKGDPGSKYDYGLITTMHETNNSSIVQSWEKFGRNQAKRRKFDYKGKNIEEVVQMIHNILD